MSDIKEKVSQKQISAMADALRDFGYNDLTNDTVKDETNKLLAGNDPDNIIGMFIKGFLEDAKIL